MLSSARRTNDWSEWRGIEKPRGGAEGGGRATRRSPRWGRLVKSAVERGSLWCASRVSRAVCRVASVSCGSASISRVSSSTDDDVFLVPTMSDARSPRRSSPATFSPSLSSSSSFQSLFSRRPIGEAARARAANEPYSSFVVALLRPHEIAARLNPAAVPAWCASREFVFAGFVRKYLCIKGGNFNAWNSRP